MSENFKKIVMVLASLAFLATMIFPLMGSLNKSPSSSEKSNATTNESEDKQLNAVVQGYEKVLAREPNNPTAKQGLQQVLEALVVTKIKQKDLNGAIPVMEKLVKVDPSNSKYKEILTNMKQEKSKLTNKILEPIPQATPELIPEPIPEPAIPTNP
ncbi:tetratricopeptide repeat protein [Aphanothece sacrum]|uniref:Type II and III secretion system protein n=1 Tax=Aphanothece sacrum FPU1 TaxID=1920663 RepID=A0A401IMI2_APHSA|nr:tetratricopeptide repeat protein [Aphanothece sacrum]GBF82462.1 type II and III secretion system protein [Aphanothece sacrum FPU1]GBF84383.1 type II and III secretion system protein [Aphanothece sacrum FPU3]